MSGDELYPHDSEPIVHQPSPFNLTVVAVFVVMVYYFFVAGLASVIFHFGFVVPLSVIDFRNGVAVLFGILLFIALLKGHNLRPCHTLSHVCALGELCYIESLIYSAIEFDWVCIAFLIFGCFLLGIFLLLRVRDDQKPILALVNCDILLHFAFAACLSRLMMF